MLATTQSLFFFLILFHLKTMIRTCRIIIMPVLHVGVQLGFIQFDKNIITMFENKGAEEDIDNFSRYMSLRGRNWKEDGENVFIKGYIFILAWHYWGTHTKIKVNLATSVARMANSNERKVYGNLKVRHHLQDIDAEEMIILKWVLTGRRMWTRFIRLTIRTNGPLLYVS